MGAGTAAILSAGGLSARGSAVRTGTAAASAGAASCGRRHLRPGLGPRDEQLLDRPREQVFQNLRRALGLGDGQGARTVGHGGRRRFLARCRGSQGREKFDDLRSRERRREAPAQTEPLLKTGIRIVRRLRPAGQGRENQNAGESGRYQSR